MGAFFTELHVTPSISLTGASGVSNGFIAQLDTNGVPMWAVGLDGESYYNEVAVDQRTGHAFVAAEILAPVTVSPAYSFTPTCYTDPLLVKYTPTGQVAWAVQFTGTDPSAGYYARSVSVGPRNAVYFTGSFQGTLNAGSFSLTAAAGAREVWVARLCADTGAVLYAQNFVGSAGGSAKAYSVSANPLTGAAYVGGHYGGSMTAGNTPTISTGANYEDIFLTTFGEAWGTSAVKVRNGGNGSEPGGEAIERRQPPRGLCPTVYAHF